MKMLKIYKSIFLNIPLVVLLSILYVVDVAMANEDLTPPPAGIIYQKEGPIKQTKTSPGKIINITSGTGFFVSNNAIITNEHVVQNCLHIKIRGAVEPGYATLTAVDKNNDLALLRTSRIARTFAPLRGNMPINIGEEVSVMGYPLGRGINGSYLIRKAVITNNRDIFEGIERIQFTDTVEQGNSGGPLLDTNGTVIGVIVGKMSFYLAGQNTENTTPIKTTSVAITLNNLKHFLAQHNIFYRTDNTLYKFADSYMENKAKDYIVNIQCVKDDKAKNDASTQANNPKKRS